jgi:hypothetical protein
MDGDVQQQTPPGEPQPMVAAETVGAAEQPLPHLSSPSRHRPPWVLPAAIGAVALLVGLGAGVGVGLAASDPTTSDQYRDVAAQLSAAQDANRVAVGRATTAEAAAASAAQAAASQKAALDQREAAVAARESAVSAVEQQVAARSVGEGIWTVGVDIEPGTYRTSEPVGSDCYWSITRSGTNGDDIIQNDIPGGGIPTVTLKEGQDFTNRRCGTFVKQ